MPINTRFTDRKTGQPIGHPALDRLICEAFGIKDDPDAFSEHYESINMFGIGALMSAKVNSFELVEEDFNTHVERCWPSNEKAKVRPEYVKKLRRFLITDYKFEAWR